jgi:glycosyltransferase involved in cell wall biosynthesis
MKILQVIGGGEKGGSKNYLMTLSQELRKKGIDVEIVCFLDDVVAEAARAHQLPITIFPMKHIADVGAISQLKAYIIEQQPDVIHTHGVRANFIARLAARKSGIPIVTTVHSSIYHDYAHPLKRLFYHRIEKLTRRYTTRFIAVAGSLKKELEQDGIPSDRIDLVYNGLSPDFQYDAQPVSLRRELGLENDIPILMTVGRLEKVKNQEMLLQIWVGLKQHHIAFHGVIVGDGPLRAELEELARLLGIENDVSFLGYRQDIFALLSGADVFLLTSTMEGLPITLLEAMAARTPVVVSEVGGMPEVVRLAQNGYTVPVHDIEQFIARIQGILGETDLKDHLAEQGYEALMQHFTSSTFISHTLDVYHKVLEPTTRDEA